MTISMYDASVPVFKQMMGTLSIILDKAQKHAMSNNIAPETLLQARLFPDMYDLTRQIQMASDFAKAVAARLANLEIPSYPDNETNFQELRQRVDKTVQFLSSIPRERVDGSEEREIVVRAGTPREKRYVALPYLLHHGLPQFFFHVTVAYTILRSMGVEIGKQITWAESSCWLRERRAPCSIRSISPSSTPTNSRRRKAIFQQARRTSAYANVLHSLLIIPVIGHHI